MKQETIFNLQAAILEIETIDEQIRDYLYPRLYQLFKNGLLNKGILPTRKPEEAIFIRSFDYNGEQIIVSYEISWGGRSDSDYEAISMTTTEWDSII